LYPFTENLIEFNELRREVDFCETSILLK